MTLLDANILLYACDERSAGRETTDGVLAAVVIENGATLASTDVGFRRIPDLRWVNPLT